MNKLELASALAKRTTLAPDLCSAILDDLLEEIALALCRGDKIVLRGFGTIEVSVRKATDTFSHGKQIHIPETRTLNIKCGDTLKSRLNRRPS